MRRFGVIAGITAAISFLAPTPGFAAAPSAVVSPVPAFAGGNVTVTITCDSPESTVSFFGDPAVFPGGGSIVGGPQGLYNFTLVNGLAPGNYPEVFYCRELIPGPDPTFPPTPIDYPVTALIVVAARPATVTPSGAPSTGGGGSQAGSGKMLGLAALTTAGLLGGATLLVRRRRAV